MVGDGDWAELGPGDLSLANVMSTGATQAAIRTRDPTGLAVISKMQGVGQIGWRGGKGNSAGSG